MPRNRQLLGHAIRKCKREWPFHVNAIVLLPDHLHAIWTLPDGDKKFAARWSIIKKYFTQQFLAAGGVEAEVPEGATRERRRGIWQRRFWEHAIEDEDDFQRHFDYIHFNPVRHGLAECPGEWEASSFHRYVKAGVYSEDWACGDQPPLDLATASDDYGEPL